jgi:ABC-type dipeptide/oligopeptide/nickel transport system permease component
VSDLRPRVWGFILMVVGGIFWIMFSVIWGVIAGFGGESLMAKALMYIFGILFFFSLPVAVIIEIGQWIKRKREKEKVLSGKAD